MKKELKKPAIFLGILIFIILTAFAVGKGGFGQIQYVLLSPTDKLYWAVRENDTKKLKKLLDRKPEIVNGYLNGGFAPLHFACLLGHYEIANVLLEHGANPNIKVDRFGTPLNIAASSADNLVGGDHKKIEQERLKILKLLLSKGAMTDNMDESNRTPLCAASDNNNLEAVKALMEAGAKIYEGDGNTGCSLVLLAARQKNKEFLDLLLSKGLSVNSCGKDNETPLHRASFTGDAAVINTLISWGVKVDPRNSRGETPLLYAVLTNNTEAVKILIDNGADINSSDDMGGTILKTASQGRNPEILKILIERGVKR